jgi:hypothetical protein
MRDQFLSVNLSDLSPELVSGFKLVYFCEMLNQVQHDEEKNPNPKTSQQ